ncbi:MAG: hypothetical protein JO115_09985 [Pseudonocardiales bacterium]|nr:hypothetical protein [Pseudonocardiales bacterium]
MSTAMTLGWLELRDAALNAARRGWPITPGTFLGPDRRWCGRDGAKALCPVQDTWQEEPVTAPEVPWVPLATVTPSRGWLLFAATGSGAVANGLYCAGCATAQQRGLGSAAPHSHAVPVPRAVGQPTTPAWRKATVHRGRGAARAAHGTARGGQDERGRG